MRCPRTSFRCCAVFSAGSNPDFDLCATVRDFHPCFPRPTDWLKCEKELFEKFEHSKSASTSRIGALIGMYPHIRICRYVVSIPKKIIAGRSLWALLRHERGPLREARETYLHTQSKGPSTHADLPRKLHPCIAREKNAHSESEFRPVCRHFFPTLELFSSRKDLARCLLHLSCSETTHGLGHNK